MIFIILQFNIFLINDPKLPGKFYISYKSYKSY